MMISKIQPLPNLLSTQLRFRSLDPSGSPPNPPFAGGWGAGESDW